MNLQTTNYFDQKLFLAAAANPSSCNVGQPTPYSAGVASLTKIQFLYQNINCLEVL